MSVLDDLMTNYQHVIEDIIVKMGTKGAFEVKVDDEFIFSKKESGRHAEPGEVLNLFKQHIGPEVEPYPQS